MAQMLLPNPYLSAQYKGKPLPMPGYEGDPTTAMGTPIQSYQDAQAAQPQGTTLNSLPAAAAAPAPAAPDPTNDSNYVSRFITGGRLPPPSGGGNDFMISRFLGADRPPPTAAAPAVAAPQAPDASVALRQAYLAALANPQGGKPMPVRGAAVPQAAPLGQPSVLSAFLAAHPSGGQTGSYNNQPFFNTLNQLRGG